MKARRPLTASAAAALVLLGLNAGPAPSGDPTGSNGLSSRKTGALQAVADLRARLERNAQMEPLARLRQAMGATPSAAELNGYAMASLLAGAPANALIVLTEAARKTPDDFLSFNNLGALLNNLGQYEAARIFLLYAAELSPDNPMVLSNLGVAELGKGRDKEAEALFLSAVARAPQHPEANYALGRMAGRRGDDQAAERYLSASLDGAYTDRAARALRSLERSSKTGPSRSAAPAGPPPSVPAHAAKAGKDLRLALPVIDADSLPDFVTAEKAFSAKERAARAIQSPVALEMKGFSDPRAFKSSKASSGSTGTTLRLGDGKARRAREQTNRWYVFWTDTNQEFGDYRTDLIKRMAAIGAEQARLWREEQRKCFVLVGRAREACLEEAERRACGRYFESHEPLLGEYRKKYAEFRPRWEDAARGYLQYTFYTASLMSDQIEAKALVTHARGTVATSYRLICSNLAGMCNVFRPPADRCFEMPPPPPPTGELRIEDFIVPCSFPGFHLAFGPVSFGVDCTTVTIGGELGPAVGELEWNFVEKQGTFFIGLSESLDWGEDLSVELSGRIGLSFSFDEDEITDIALEAEANLGASLDLWLKTVDLGEARAAGRIGLNSAATFE